MAHPDFPDNKTRQNIVVYSHYIDTEIDSLNFDRRKFMIRLNVLKTGGCSRTRNLVLGLIKEHESLHSTTSPFSP